jgi:anthranilate/para-aminobenzoate synthase component II
LAAAAHLHEDDLYEMQSVQGLDNPFEAARYHSLVIEKDSCPGDLEVTAWTEDGIIMGVQHKQHAHIQVCYPRICTSCPV